MKRWSIKEAVLNKIQYKRWKDFALRMADNGWPKTITRNHHHKNIVRPAVEECFNLIKHNGQPAIIRILDWDSNRYDYINAKLFSWGVRANEEECVGNAVDIIIRECWNPYYYESERLFEKWDDQWGSRIRCCLRAGLDLACSPTGGVVGFSKKDIERMYPEGVPKWITNGWSSGPLFGDKSFVAWKDIKDDQSLWL